MNYRQKAQAKKYGMYAVYALIALIGVFFLLPAETKFKIKAWFENMKKKIMNLLNPTTQEAGTQTTGSKASRGIRNNNPLNIKYNAANDWLGKVPYAQNTDKVFEQFTEMKYGRRAALILLKNYIKGGHATPRKIVTRWSEDNHAGYLDFVAKNTGFNLDGALLMTDRGSITKLAAVMASFELGVTQSQSDFDKAWDLIAATA